MGQQIIRQPDGGLAVFSTITDTILIYDATAEEIINWRAEQAAEDARRVTREQLKDVIRGEPFRVYFQFAMTWQDALEKDRDHGGEAWRDFLAPERTP
jgi:hypothetical protein